MNCTRRAWLALRSTAATPSDGRAAWAPSGRAPTGSALVPISRACAAMASLVLQGCMASHLGGSAGAFASVHAESAHACAVLEDDTTRSARCWGTVSRREGTALRFVDLDANRALVSVQARDMSAGQYLCWVDLEGGTSCTSLVAPESSIRMPFPLSATHVRAQGSGVCAWNDDGDVGCAALEEEPVPFGVGALRVVEGSLSLQSFGGLTNVRPMGSSRVCATSGDGGSSWSLLLAADREPRILDPRGDLVDMTLDHALSGSGLLSSLSDPEVSRADVAAFDGAPRVCVALVTGEVECLDSSTPGADWVAVDGVLGAVSVSVNATYACAASSTTVSCWPLGERFVPPWLFGPVMSASEILRLDRRSRGASR